MNSLIKRSLLNALGTVVYVILVALIMTKASGLFGSMNNLLQPIAFLMLFVLSAVITTSLIFGKPVLMYWNGEKAEAVKLFLYTVGWLAGATIILLALNLK
jgi:preprotein translocase subunit SecF